MEKLPRIAIISSLTGGLGHYCSHLVGPLSKHITPKFITYPQVDSSGTVVNHIADNFVANYIKWPRFDIDESNPNSIVNIYDYLEKRDIKLVNIHVATTVKKKIEYFTTFVLYGKYYNKAKFIFTLHDVLPFEDDKRLIKLLKVFYSLGDSFVVGNNEEKDKLIKYFNIPTEKINVIHIGIYNLFDKQRYTKEKARHYLNINNKNKVILFFGWMRGYKGFDTLIEAAKKLSEIRQDFTIYTVSGLKYALEDEKTTYLKKIHELNLDKNFLLSLNYLNSTDIETVFKASDLVVLPYTHSSQSAVLMTSVGFKKPVIITDVFSDKNWVKNNAGFVINVGDATDLAEKTNHLLENPLIARGMGEYGYDYAMSHFNWDTIAKNYSEVFNKFK